jgi:hypothetical protein
MGLGGNVKIVISGAAPLAPHVEEFLRVVTCAPVVQGYGMHSNHVLRPSCLISRCRVCLKFSTWPNISVGALSYRVDRVVRC